MSSIRISKIMLALSLIVVLGSACSGKGSGGPTPTPLPTVESYEKTIYTVEQGKIVSDKKLLGEIVPLKQEELFFKAGGYVSRVTTKAGEQVKKGDILAEQQIDDFLNQLEQAKIDLEVTQANLAKGQLNRKYAIEKAKIDVETWKKRVQLAKMDLMGTGNLERAKLDLGIAQDNLAMAEINLQEAQEDTSTFEQQAVDRSLLDVKRLESLIAERRIVAPYDGIVLRNSVRPGQQVDAFTSLMVVGDPTQQIIRARYDRDVVQNLTPESDIRMNLSSDSKENYQVKYLPNFLPVSSASSDSSTGTSSDSSTSDWIYFELPAELTPDQIPLGGRTVSILATLGEKDNVLLLPPAAIRNFRGLNFVIVLDGQKRRRVEINEIGLKTTEKWEISADLQPGDQVLGP
jgi:HlyD family secretion protein